MLFGKRLEKELTGLRSELEKKNKEIERLNSKFESLEKEVDRISDRVSSQFRIMKNHVDGKITYQNVPRSPYHLSLEPWLEYVYIYKDNKEYKFNGIKLDNPVITKLSENLLKVYDKEATYIFDLSNEKVIKY